METVRLIGVPPIKIEILERQLVEDDPIVQPEGKARVDVKLVGEEIQVVPEIENRDVVVIFGGRLSLRLSRSQTENLKRSL